MTPPESNKESNVHVPSKSLPSKTYDTLLSSIPALQAMDSVVHKFKVDPLHGRQMFSICIKNSITPQLLDKIKFIQTNMFLAQAQETDYMEFAKKRLHKDENDLKNEKDIVEYGEE